MEIERFEDIQGWQKARFLTKKIYELSNKPPLKRDRGLCNQIQEPSVSIMANIAEGFDRQSKKEFSRFLYYASGSASEAQSHLYVALNRNYITKEVFEETYKQAVITKNLINGFIKYLEGRE
jgi:four helix bundle protein